MILTRAKITNTLRVKSMTLTQRVTNTLQIKSMTHIIKRITNTALVKSMKLTQILRITNTAQVRSMILTQRVTNTLQVKSITLTQRNITNIPRGILVVYFLITAPYIIQLVVTISLKVFTEIWCTRRITKLKGTRIRKWRARRHIDETRWWGMINFNWGNL